MRRSIFFLLPALVFAGLAWVLYRGLYLDPREVPTPLIDRPAPDFRVASLEAPERFVSRTDMLGKVWLLNSWASWCVACRQEHPVLVEFARSGIVPIVGLDYKDRRADGMRWLAQFGDPYVTSAFDESGRIGIDYGLTGVPESFLIDKHGRVRFKQTGPFTAELLHDTLVPLIHRLQAEA